MAGPLAGVRVIEIAQEIQGPYAGLFLADMGATVIKVEKRGVGDLSRYMLVGRVAERFADGDVENPEVSHYFLAMNRGKRSVTLDLKKAEAKQVLYRFLDSADVLLTNYRPGVLDRLGFGYAELRERNPRLIYAAGSSWGPDGPWRQRPSRDTLAQAAGGIMAKNGMPGTHPVPCGALVADHSGAITLLSGILAALYARERTGRGQKVDASIYGTMLALQPMEIDFTSLSGGVEPPRAGRGHPFLGAMWGAFRTKDGWICLAGVGEERWPGFCRVMGLDRAPFDDPMLRYRSAEALNELLDELFPRRTTDEWLADLTAIDVLVSPVQDYRDILGDEQALANGYICELDHPEVGKVKVVGNPIRLSDTPLATTTPPPELGQHSEEILLREGFSWEEIAELRAKEAI